MTERSGFPPVVGKKPESLILGSMPGEESLRQGEYYAHKRNSFWTILCRLLGCDPANLDYEGRTKLLEHNHLALWDVLKSCRRAGSLDSSIETETIIVNDFNSLYQQYPSIRTVFFNGTRAEQEYRKRVLPFLKDEGARMKLIRLPSTSPAMAMMKVEEKIEKWSLILKYSNCFRNPINSVDT
ncbi:MAG: DNA-deoxyinosine glycosylase [Proteobacteria bacterium]|nr:DNA-deoxyinosine glycosylase [Pseudomonadota bacterium]MBU1739043.1 DNA-deoxyinosine glycosylase [Pseudomonadota bacterium]